MALAADAASATVTHSRTKGDGGGYWQLAIWLITAIIGLPVIVICASLLQEYSGTWQHLIDTVLRDYVFNSLILMLGVGAGSFMLGVSSAWLTSMYQFPGRRLLSWALLLPMAMPAYIIAYTYTGLLDFSGPVQSALRDTFEWRYGDYWFPSIRSRGGAIAMLSLVLYPYVYLLARVCFSEQSGALLEASRSLGKGPWQTFVRVALPLARPAIVAGISLALMETLADYGTVKYFGVSTFTTGIFRTWYGLGELRTAAQLASFLLLFVFALIAIERWSRSRMRYHHSGAAHPPERLTLSTGPAVACSASCFAIVFFGFLLPAAQLAVWASGTWRRNLNMEFLQLLGNSFVLAAATALLCLLLALILGYGQRLYPRRRNLVAVRLCALGYAVPGTIVAVGVLIPLGAIDNRIDSWMRASFDLSSGLLLSGTITALIFAYTVRFLSVALQSVESGLLKIRPSIDDSARSLGASPVALLRRIHLPLLRNSLLTALLLVFVDVLKELPSTLILRPFNFNTLAVRSFELASDERLIDAATPALAIVLVGLLPVALINRSLLREK